MFILTYIQFPENEKLEIIEKKSLLNKLEILRMFYGFAELSHISECYMIVH